MPDQHRPGADTVERFGARVTIDDPAGVLVAARIGLVELWLTGPLPPPVHSVRLTAHTVDATCRLSAEIRATSGLPSGTLRLLALGVAGPAGWLLARHLTADRDGPLARRAGRIAAQASRRLGRPAPTVVADRERPVDPAAAELRGEAAALGLRAEEDVTAVEGGRLVALRATVPAGQVSVSHLRALVGLTLQAVRDLAGDEPEPRVLKGRAYALRRPRTVASARPAPRAAAPVRPAGSESVTLDQVGGLDDVVARFREIAISFRHPDVMARWGARRPQGILLYGPPGTGKTMLARALANEIGADFREIRTPEILDKWLGGSERNIKQIFREARRYRQPTVLLFDEFDSIISYAGAGGDAASQAVNAVAGIFKQEMNTLIEENPHVIVVATTNFPQRVDASLVRSGRFDVKLSIPPPDEPGRAQIITKMIRDLVVRHDHPGFRMFADDVDPAALAAASAGLTGADIREVLRRVQLAKAMREATGGRPVGPIGQADLLAAIEGLRRG
ncbi:AAA family ATPase [Micromonospora sp. H33]|uniref:ATP-binding protein n=1 Tax=Micromonospora sp. H33 TaxID=3452215 RepID=UPI003F89F3B4